MDGVDVSVIVNNKDNKITTTVESVSDLTGTTLINQVYLQPSTGNKYSAFDISSSLVSTDGFTHVYEGTLPADTITSNHCITSIVSTDTCATSIFDDLLSSAWGVYSFEQQVLGAPKYKDINGVDDVDTNINVIYNQININNNTNLSTLVSQTKNTTISIVDKVSDGFDVNDNVTNYRLSPIYTGSSFTPTSITDFSYTIDLKLISFTSGQGSVFGIGNTDLIFDFWVVDSSGDLKIKTQISGITTTSPVITNINSRKTIGVTKSGQDLLIYLDGVYSTTYTSGYTSTQIGWLELADEVTKFNIKTRHIFVWDYALTASDHLSIYNEKYL